MTTQASEISLKERIFTFLDGLRKSGETNMFGASPFIQNEFDIDEKEAYKFLVEWMRTFGERHPE